jgi:predicted glycosyltransferase
VNKKHACNRDSTKHILIDIGHPAHVHLFRNFIAYLKENSIRHTVTSRNKDVTEALLEHYDIQHEIISRQSSGLVRQFLEFLTRTLRILRLHRRSPFTLALGTSVSIGYLTLLTFGRVRSYNFCEDDDDTIPLQSTLAYPFSSRIVNPKCIRFKRWRHKRILLPSYHELAYLHQSRFTPDPSILEKYDLQQNKFLILRLSSLSAHHDREERGIPSELIPRIRHLAGGRTIIESHETKRTHSIEPWDMIQLLYFASMLICDSQTMTAEAAILGTPTVRISTFKNRLSCIEEIEAESLHAFSFLPEETASIEASVKRLMDQPPSQQDRMTSRAGILQHRIDLTSWMIQELLERRPNHV